MLILIPFLAAALISCFPLSEDPKEQNDQNWNVGLIDSSNIAFEKDEGTEIGLNDIAEACSSSPNNNGILRRESMCKPTRVVEPEKPSEGVTLQPKLYSDYRVKSPSDPECVNFPLRPHYVTCGGPEVYGISDQFHDSSLVYNCFAGMTFYFHSIVLQLTVDQDLMINLRREDGSRLQPNSLDIVAPNSQTR